jgi:2-dehydropantoate 2-reductase
VRICVVGAGAIGGLVGAELALAGEEVTLIARGAQLDAIRERGLRLVRDGEERVAHPRALADPAGAGPQDVVMLAVKAHSLPELAGRLGPLFGPETAVVTMVNGIPWWYFHRHPEPQRDWILDTVDPGGRIWRAIGPERAIGCVVYPACDVPEPGLVVHESDDRFTLGEPDGASSERCRRLSEVMGRARLKAPVRAHIRNEIWIKLWGSATFNPISVLTGATLDVIVGDPDTRAICQGLMLEIQAVAEVLGVRFGIPIDRRLAGAAAVGAHRTSMLQDLERGRRLEIDALVGAIQELGRRVGVATPKLDAILALVVQRARTAGLYQPPSPLSPLSPGSPVSSPVSPPSGR